MKNRQCPSCHNNLPDGARFCPSCGEKIGQENQKTQKIKTATKKQISSYTILTAAFIGSLLVILYVLNDNRQILSEKLQTQGTAGAAPENASPQAQAMMNSVLELREKLEQDPDNYDLLVQMANSYFDIGRYEQAIDFYLRAYDVNKTEADMIIDLGVAFFNINNADSALVYMRKALDIEPRHKQGLYNTGIVYYNLGEYEQAITTWEKLVNYNPDSREAEAAREFIKQLKTQMNQS